MWATIFVSRGQPLFEAIFTALLHKQTVFPIPMEGIIGPNGFSPPRAIQREDNNKTNVEPVHSYDTFHTRFVGLGVEAS